MNLSISSHVFRICGNVIQYPFQSTKDMASFESLTSSLRFEIYNPDFPNFWFLYDSSKEANKIV